MFISRSPYRLGRLFSIALVTCLLSSSTPAAPQIIVALARQGRTSFAFWYNTTGLKQLLLQGEGGIRRQERQADRDARVARLQILPGDVTIDITEDVTFSAIAYDRNGDPINGVKVNWNGRSASPGQRVRLSRRGNFKPKTPGVFTVTAEAAGKTARATVTVRQGERPDLNAPPRGTRTVSSRDLPPGLSSAKPTGPNETTSPKNRTESNRRRAHKRTTAVANASTPMMLGDGGWDETNYWSADDPGNRVGDPPGTPADGGAGSGNFQFTAPVYAAPGRGLNVSLNLVYNSRLWNKAGNQISYDNDRGWPAPGFNLGFGKLLGMTINTGCMIVEGDGTRHGYTGTITFYNWGTHGVMHTTDGSFIDYDYWTGTNGIITSATAKYPNGTIVNYGANGPGGVFPTSIEDANGNFVAISYVNNSGPRIQAVTDTLGRVINFHYDGNNLLTAVTSPGYNGAGARTLIRFYYEQLALNYGFNGLTPSVRDPNPWVMKAIYYPGTATGYWFNDSDSYSSYGMLRKVVAVRNMGFDNAPLNVMGNFTVGSVTRREIYSYPLTPDYSLTDAPTYTTLLEEWLRDGTNFDSATTGYEVHANDNPRTTTITLPNGTKSKQYSYNSPGSFLDGLVYEDRTFTSDENNPLQSSRSNWEQGAYGAPRPSRVERKDERQQMIAAEFSYGPYNQVLEARDYDYVGALMRSTRSQYQNSVNYVGTMYSSGHVGRHIFNLPLNVDIYASDNTTRVSRTEYQYDGQTLTDTPDVLMHDDTHNPYAPQYEQCDCNEWDHWQINCLQWNCYWTSVYNPGTDYRGNITQVTNYADAYNLTGAVVDTRRYDITGNMLTTTTACCEQTSFTYTVDTQYAYPQLKTRGSASDPYAQVSTSAIYDFNTGVTRYATDPNNRTAETVYDPQTLRVTTVASATGAHTDYEYNDAQMTVTTTTYLEAHPTHSTIADKSVRLLNGRGSVWQEQARAADEGGVEKWDRVDVTFDAIGQPIKQTRPYRVGTTAPNPTLTTYDALGRTIKIIAPDYSQPDGSDGSATELFYNELTRPDVASNQAGEAVRIRDAWGRERWGLTDAIGRLVEVVEANPGGNGSVATGGLVTRYTYNTLGKLIAINSMNGTQVQQARAFAYDSLGRLTAQKLAEASATLNDVGTYVGSGSWSDVFTYDARSNLSTRTDARGVKTVYGYNNDPLNRLQSISWDTTGFGDSANPILPAAAVTYQYRTKSSGAEIKDITQVQSITTAGVATESYTFDGEGRINSKTLTLNARGDYPFVTNYSFDSLDRIIDVLYPTQYPNPNLRKMVHHSYDIASRLNALTYDGQSFASNILYNPASQTASLKVGTGSNQIVESYSYSSQTGFLDNQTVARTASPTNYLLNLSYVYTNAGGKRTGQLTKVLNNLNPNKDRGYAYDALGRLVQATGGPAAAPIWTQTYSYDRYGNRTSVNASGYSALNRSGQRDGQSETASVSQPGAAATGSGTLLARNTFDREKTRLAGEKGRAPDAPLSDSPPTLYRPSSPSEPPAYTDNPLGADVTVKSVHITELRAAIDTFRQQRGFSAYAWQHAAGPGSLITANPVLEMRTALDQVLGPPAGGYSAGLAQGQSILAVHIQELRDRVNNNWNTSLSIPRDGHASLAYDTGSNRITTTGFEYDAAGNQVRALIPGGTASQRYRYDAANRLAQVRTDDNNTIIAGYTYGDDNQRLVRDESGTRIYYIAQGLSVVSEYVEAGSSVNPAWSASYVYLGSRLLSTVSPNGGGGENVAFHHPDRLGTRIVTNPATGGSSEQVTLPFGTDLSAESSNATKRRFTSYERSDTTKLDYAVNRQYDAQQGRFTQVDPIGMQSVNIDNPQTLNLYAYCTNDPINHLDPDGLGFLSFLKKIFKYALLLLVTALVVALVVVAVTAVLPGLAAWMIAHPTILAITLALLGIVAQHFVLTVYNGIADEIREHGFSLGSLFRGFFKGVGRFFKSLIKPLYILNYGNYCGPGNPNQSAEREPIDALDAACREHDRVYQDPNATSRDKARADFRLAWAAFRALISGRLGRPGQTFSLFVIVVFPFVGLGRLLFGGGDSSQEPTTVNVSSSGSSRPAMPRLNRPTYRMSPPTYFELMNASPQRLDRLQLGGT